MNDRDVTLDSSAPSLSSDALALRLHELAGNERQVQVDFLLHLDEFDRRRAFLEAGYESLWVYCLRALHLREGPAGRRIAAMRVLRRFPALEAALRDGRLCLSTITLLGPLLTQENLDDLVARAAYRTKAEVEHLVASLHPRTAPKEGIRKLPERRAPSSDLALAPVDSGPVPEIPIDPPVAQPATPIPVEAIPQIAAVPHMRDCSRVELRPVSSEQWSLRVTIDAAAKADLETLASLLSHAKGGDLAAVLREAIRCGIEKYGKRKGAVAPKRRKEARVLEEAPAAEAPSDCKDQRDPRVAARTPIPAQVRREVWQRDGGCCTWTSKDGRRCGSRWKLEFDHIRPAAYGGAPTTANVRILCKRHNLLYAEQTFGRAHMALFVSPRSSQDK